MLWIVFLASSAALINLAVGFRDVPAAFATTAVSLWPSGILSSICINNDVGFYAFTGFAMLYITRWWHSDKSHQLLLSALFIALASLIKTTAVVLVATLGWLMLMKLCRHRNWRQWQTWKSVLGAGVVITVGCALSLGRKILYYQQGKIADWITGNSTSLLGDWLKVPAKLGNFLPMDAATFVSHPWIDLGNDATGRYNFWNVLLRTSLTGEYSFDGRLQEWVSIIWGILLLAILISMAARAKKMASAASVWSHMPLLLISILWLASLISFRAHASYACNNDFRYILPIIVPFTILCVTVGTFARNLLIVLVSGSIVFFTTMGFG